MAGERHGHSMPCVNRPEGGEWSASRPGKDPVPIVQEAGWAQGPVWKSGKSRPTGIRSPDRPARSQSLYRLSYLAHIKYTSSSEKLCTL